MVLDFLISWNNIKYNKFNILLIKSHMDLHYAKSRCAYLWQNQTWLKDEVIHSCQVILTILFPRVEALLSLYPPAKRLEEREQKNRNSAATPIWQLQNYLKAEKSRIIDFELYVSSSTDWIQSLMKNGEFRHGIS